MKKMTVVWCLLAATWGLVASAASNEPVKTGQAVETAPWVNISDELFQRLGVGDMKPDYMRRCVGMAVTPTGEIFILVSKNHGVCVSRDHGATWTVVPDNNVTGRCETGFGFSIAYPYDGRLAFFAIDGTGGITLDGGRTWRPFTKILRSFEFADVDWNVPDPQAIFGLLHEPFFTVLSTDGGRNWQQLYKDDEAPKAAQKSVSQYCLGLIDANTLVRSHRVQGGIAMSTDAGKTWTEVANYKVLGRRPVHFGKKVGSLNGKCIRRLSPATQPPSKWKCKQPTWGCLPTVTRCSCRGSLAGPSNASPATTGITRPWTPVTTISSIPCRERSASPGCCEAGTRPQPSRP